MSALSPLELRGVGGTRSARFGADSRFLALHLAAVESDFVHTSGDGESCALLLGGTFDLRGGATQWPNRGARATPFEGRPVAVFLPPRTEFAASSGRGEILVIEAKRPVVARTEGRAALHQSPLLPLSGSGKSFDPTRGEWLPAESFPTAAESLPPRRIAQVMLGDVRVERVFAADYKAEALCVDEFVVPAGRTADLGTLPLAPTADEALLFVRGNAGTRVERDGESLAVDGDVLLRVRGSPGRVRITSGNTAAYAVFATAPK